MWRVEYVTAPQLAGFRQYKYSAVDTNPLSIYVMQPLWDLIVKVLIGVYLLTATFGVEFWQKPVLFHYYLKDILIFLVVVCCVLISLPQMFYNIYIMIICQMTNTRSEVLHWLIPPLAIVVSTVISGLQGRWEELILAAFTIIVTAVHIHYGFCVVKQLSRHFNIYVFSLKYFQK